MKQKIIRILLPILFLMGNCLAAQFNTLTPIISQKIEVLIPVQKMAETKDRKDKKSWKDVFNFTSRSDLKTELDSLKSLMKQYNGAGQFRKMQYENLQDSLHQLILKSENDKIKNNTQIQQPINISDEKEWMPSLSKIVMPLKSNLYITSGYGSRIHPIFGSLKMHNGIDLKANYEDVHAVLDGIITEAGWDSKGGGNYIKIKHFNRFETSYLHLSEIFYKVGKKVRAGFIIGKSGNTGNSTGPHLHFAVKEFGQSINPYHFLNDLNKANNLIATYYAN
ncbi:M23 family metallopeptidase [Chryseobacterium arthrosphaerae]|uniref:M23 family metallopeptidase n=1 Tax=Chryseobacterium arthrosphaerae TaxID=651561 RepID=UPI001BB03F92|nr:M23 family metallopeptidase [Chryseobacterium arthrosphaerae]QUY55677.1 M23 family metallopeptidase [Chryseobacterium arthrosphaerae]